MSNITTLYNIKLQLDVLFKHAFIMLFTCQMYIHMQNHNSYYIFMIKVEKHYCYQLISTHTQSVKFSLVIVIHFCLLLNCHTAMDFLLLYKIIYFVLQNIANG